MTKILGIGWDVGGWMGTKQGIAASSFDTQTKELNWIGNPINTKINEPVRWTPEGLLHLLGGNESLSDFDEVVIGIDASLGFPIAYRNLVNMETVSPEKPTKEIYNPYAYRETERHVYEKFGKKPLSATFDKLGNNATLALTYSLDWSHNQDFNIHPQQQTESDGKVIIEVYPALVKTMKPLFVKEKILSLIPSNVPVNSDAYDAAICSLSALLYKGNGRFLENISLCEPSINPETARAEGWIYYPEGR